MVICGNWWQTDSKANIPIQHKQEQKKRMRNDSNKPGQFCAWAMMIIDQTPSSSNESMSTLSPLGSRWNCWVNRWILTQVLFYQSIWITFLPSFRRWSSKFHACYPKKLMSRTQCLHSPCDCIYVCVLHSRSHSVVCANSCDAWILFSTQAHTQTHPREEHRDIESARAIESAASTPSNKVSGYMYTVYTTQRALIMCRVPCVVYRIEYERRSLISSHFAQNLRHLKCYLLGVCVQKWSHQLTYARRVDRS